MWSSDLTPETTPDEAGLSFCVKLGKPGGFLGAEALRLRRSLVEAGAQAGAPPRRLACLTMVDPDNVAIGGEPVRIGGKVLGRITSAGFGYTTGASIAYAYLPLTDATLGTPAQVDLFGTWVDATIAPDTLYDPAAARPRA
jgi:glycine cleavage system aminomethyltransferase T